MVNTQMGINGLPLRRRSETVGVSASRRAQNGFGVLAA